MRSLLAKCSTLIATGLLTGACLLSADTNSHESGLVIQTNVGPSCPVMQQEEPCPDRPLSAELEIVDARGQIIAQVETDQEGRARVPLRPGGYTVRPLSDSPVIPPSPPLPIEISIPEGEWIEVLLTYDSGIR